MQHITHNSNCWTVQLFCCFTTQGQDCCLSVIMITQRVFVTTHTQTHEQRSQESCTRGLSLCCTHSINCLPAFCTPNAKSSRIRNQESVRDILGSPDSSRNDFQLRMSGVYRWDSFVGVHYSKNNNRNNNNSKSKQSKLSTHIQWLPRESSSNSLNDFKFEVCVILQVKSRPGTKLWQKFN